ncbi:MAG: DUF922 domain-containing protein [Patescibacteria group bacterium]|nr:DUF922 domain-containing protein [Patescibacteria group bacterium]
MKNINSKLKNDKSFLIVLIIVLLIICTLTFSGCAFLAWKAYPTIYILLMNRNSTSKNLNYNTETDNKIEKQETVFVPIKEELKVQEKTTYYDISGLTSEELNQQMQTLGPEWTSTERVYAMANYSINWSLPLKTNDGGCTETEVETKIEYIMPRWINYEEASLDMQQKWDNYYPLLLKHEETHGKIVKEEAEKYFEEIKNIKDYTSCQDFDDKVYPIHEKYLLKIGELNDNYDNETNHGVTEGVVLY